VPLTYLGRPPNATGERTEIFKVPRGKESDKDGTDLKEKGNRRRIVSGVRGMGERGCSGGGSMGCEKKQINFWLRGQGR